MKRRKGGRGRRLLAACMALFMLCLLLPVQVFAQVIPVFTVQLQNGGSVDSSIDGWATLTLDGSSELYHTVPLNSGKAVFTNIIDDSNTYALTITGMAGYEDDNTTQLTPLELMMGVYVVDTASLAQDTTAPEITGLAKTPDGWTRDAVTVEVTVTDNKAVDVLGKVYYSTNQAEYDNQLATEEAAQDPDTGAFSFTLQSATSVEKVYIWAYDAAGNVSPCSELAVNIDVDNPTITGMTFAKTDAANQVINFLEFGTMSGDDVLVTLTATDAGGSGVDSMTLYYDGIAITESAVETGLGTGVWEAEFRLSTGILTDGVLYGLSAKAADKAGNQSDPVAPLDFASGGIPKSDSLMLDETAPTVTVTPQSGHENGGAWWHTTTNNVAFDVALEDAGSGLCDVEVEINGTQVFSAHIWQPGASAATPTWSNTTLDTGLHGGLANNADVEIKVTATDNAGNETESVTNLRADTAPPDITNFEIRAKDASAPMDPLSYQTYGTFFNDKVIVTVTADDAGSSGIQTIELYEAGNPAPIASAAAVDGKAEFELPAGAVTEGSVLFAAGLEAKATDNLGNAMSSPEFAAAAGSALKSQDLMIETVKPVVSVSTPAPVYTDADGKRWHNGPAAFAVSVGDADSGIRSVAISLNGAPILQDQGGKAVDAPFHQNQTHSESFTIHTDQAARADDGAYSLTVTVVDNAGNQQQATHAIYLDTAAPVIADFAFEAAGVTGSSGLELSVEKRDYGFFFKADTRVTITAQDPAPGSGVRSITYYTVDITGGKSAETTVLTTGEATFILPADFKGQIYAKAADNVGFEAARFVNPDGVIVESPAKHAEETHIELARAATRFTDRDGLDLYPGDVTASLTVTDTFSGLRRVEWKITAPGDTARNTGGSINIANDGTITGDKGGWSVSGTEDNLITGMKGTVKASNNSNGITLWVKITDRAGNTSEESTTFSIDKTAPTITVTYDNNSPDPVFTDYYKADRTATITITERNFRAGDVQVSITSTGDEVPGVSNWTTAWNASNPDETTHTATVRYTADGDYTFDIRYSDNAGNPAARFEQHAFTIDKTAPRIAVTYDNNQPVNGEYYPTSRTATITITEHNFETSRIKITGTATNSGAAAAFPATSGWTSRGDVHTAHIVYAADARYTFTMAYTDKAGNEAAAFERHAFIIDQTAPTLEIIGVADKSANNGDVIPIVRFSDTNFDADTLSISLTGATRQAVQPAGQYTSQPGGRVFTFDNFERKREVDDLYTLTAKVADRAGNETSKTISFSVNRFGSVYALDTALRDIERKYVQSPVDVVVTETNVDDLRRETIRVKLTYNGVPKDLIEGADYTVNQTGGEGLWSQYRYTIPKALFAGEGSYVVTLYSVDAAGNVNENIQESKKAEIAFGVDKTPPAIVSIGLESGQQYPMDSLQAAVSVTDNLVLTEVRIYLNGEEIGEQGAFDQTFVVPASNSKQDLRVVAHDAAGNESTLEIRDFLVTTSLFYRWYNNTPLVIGTLAGAAGLVALLVFLIIKMRARART